MFNQVIEAVEFRLKPGVSVLGFMEAAQETINLIQSMDGFIRRSLPSRASD